MNPYRLPNALTASRQICKEHLTDGSYAVDCTMGNGHDTLLLAQCVGTRGKVYAFDIQEIAIHTTRQKLNQSGLLERAELIHDGHENLDGYVRDDVDLFLFNLGYLPKSDHQLTTMKESTLCALKKALKLLRKNGLILLVAYPGHPEGKEEELALRSFLRNLDQKCFDVMSIEYPNQINDPPILFVLQKKIIIPQR